jgi:hypothetical protein
MARAVKREAAKRDLTDQWIWYAENANIETADRFFAVPICTVCGDSPSATDSRRSCCFIFP